jgi:hypothetical protein
MTTSELSLLKQWKKRKRKGIHIQNVTGLLAKYMRKKTALNLMMVTFTRTLPEHPRPLIIDTYNYNRGQWSYETTEPESCISNWAYETTEPESCISN